MIPCETPTNHTLTITPLQSDDSDMQRRRSFISTTTEPSKFRRRRTKSTRNLTEGVGVRPLEPSPPSSPSLLSSIKALFTSSVLTPSEHAQSDRSLNHPSSTSSIHRRGSSREKPLDTDGRKESETISEPKRIFRSFSELIRKFGFGGSSSSDSDDGGDGERSNKDDSPDMHPQSLIGDDTTSFKKESMIGIDDGARVPSLVKVSRSRSNIKSDSPAHRRLREQLLRKHQSAVQTIIQNSAEDKSPSMAAPTQILDGTVNSLEIAKLHFQQQKVSCTATPDTQVATTVTQNIQSRIIHVPCDSSVVPPPLLIIDLINTKAIHENDSGVYLKSEPSQQSILSQHSENNYKPKLLKRNSLSWRQSNVKSPVLEEEKHSNVNETPLVTLINSTKAMFLSRSHIMTFPAKLRPPSPPRSAIPRVHSCDSLYSRNSSEIYEQMPESFEESCKSLEEIYKSDEILNPPNHRFSSLLDSIRSPRVHTGKRKKILLSSFYDDGVESSDDMYDAESPLFVAKLLGRKPP